MRGTKQQDRSLTMMFLVILTLGFASGFIFVYQMLLPFLFDYTQSISFVTFSYLFLFINLIISPILVFIGIYYIGKKIDLKTKLSSSIIRLLSGAFTGYFLGYTIAHLFSGYEFETFVVPYLSGVMSLLFSSLSMFFTAFTALAIAYIRHTNRIDSEPSLPKTEVEGNL
jgi:hypothetical protein